MSVLLVFERDPEGNVTKQAHYANVEEATAQAEHDIGLGLPIDGIYDGKGKQLVSAKDLGAGK